MHWPLIVIVVVAASRQMFSLVIYVADLPGLREQLIAIGWIVPETQYPTYMPSGELRLTDPDGYAVTVCHWGREQQKAWEEHLRQRGNVTE